MYANKNVRKNLFSNRKVTTHNNSIVLTGYDIAVDTVDGIIQCWFFEYQSETGFLFISRRHTDSREVVYYLLEDYEEG